MADGKDKKDEQPKADETAVWDGSLSADDEQVAPDGHVTLSKADIKARD